MPPFRFLFETRKVVGEPSPKAIQALLPASHQPPAGHEIVPTIRAERLVSYLLSLKDTYAYPEAANVYVAQTEGQSGAAAEGAQK
jgi:cytochrome c oxidase cbb3-type subunit 2